MAVNPITGAPYLTATDAPDLAGITAQIAAWTAQGNVLLKATDEADRDAKFSAVPAPAMCVSKDRPALWVKVTDTGTSADWLTVWEEYTQVGPGFVPDAGWSVAAENFSRVGKVASGYLRLIRTGAAIAAAGTGDIVNVVLGQVPSGFEPRLPVSAGVAATGIMVGGHIWTDGGAGIGALPPGVGIATDQQISFSATWLVP